MQISVTPWSEALAEEGRALLEKYLETSLFLLSNLKECGPSIGELFYSGNFKCLVKGNTVVAVFCLSRKGNVLLQSDREQDYSGEILGACLEEGIAIKGCVADWPLAEAFWKAYTTQFPDIKTGTYSKELRYCLSVSPSHKADSSVRLLTEEEAGQWELMNTAYFEELRFPAQGSVEERKTAFRHKAQQKHWWGTWEDRQLVGIAAFNAKIDGIAQIGGVYVLPDYRRQGIASRMLSGLIRDASSIHGIHTLVLFTDQENIPAQALYQQLGFRHTGHFGLIFV